MSKGLSERRKRNQSITSEQFKLPPINTTGASTGVSNFSQELIQTPRVEDAKKHMVGVNSAMALAASMEKGFNDRPTPPAKPRTLTPISSPATSAKGDIDNKIKGSDASDAFDLKSKNNNNIKLSPHGVNNKYLVPGRIPDSRKKKLQALERSSSAGGNGGKRPLLPERGLRGL